MRRLKLALALAAFLAVAGPVAGTARASAYEDQPWGVGCVVFEDDSFVCGHLVRDGWVDPYQPRVAGCIPGGLCDTDWTDDCPPGLEDVECWMATHD
jgi:hypothetical protein